MVGSKINPKAYLLLILLLFTIYLVRRHLIPALQDTHLTSRHTTEDIARPATVTDGEGRLVMGLPIDINTATARDLAALPGIGPAIAGAIIATRRNMGGFASLDDLLKVKGIGPKRLAAIREMIVSSEIEGG